MSPRSGSVKFNSSAVSVSSFKSKPTISANASGLTGLSNLALSSIVNLGRSWLNGSLDLIPLLSAAALAVPT